MSDEPEVALVGCGPVKGREPNVPSEQRPCHKCGEMLWVGSVLLDDLHEMGYDDAHIWPMCIFTCMVISDDMDVNGITDNQRKELRGRGMTDEQIDEMTELINASIQRGDLQ